MDTTERAVRAAVAAARGQGLPVLDPRVVRDSTNVLVHLAPAPVIARVSLTFARLRGADWAAEHVRLASFLADAGAPVAPPAADVDPGPHVCDGLCVTFWALVDHDPARARPAAVGHALRDLHEALSAWREPLASCDRLGEVGRLLASLEPSEVVSAAELEGLRSLHAGLSPLPGRPIHGDSHFRNVLWTRDGPLWTDLENACEGPVEWDIACITWRDAPGTAEALAAYGPYDEEVASAVMPALMLFLAAWTIVVAERQPTPGGVGEARRRVARALAAR